jgi:myosin heavy subunit
VRFWERKIQCHTSKSDDKSSHQTPESTLKNKIVNYYMLAQRTRWIGHFVRMDKESMVKRLTEWRPTTVGRIGRSRLRCEDGVRANLEKMKIQNWSEMAMDREAWKRIAEQAKTHKQL